MTDRQTDRQTDRHHNARLLILLFIFCFLCVLNLFIYNDSSYMISMESNEYVFKEKPINQSEYSHGIKSTDRFLSIGFDDFRESDFSMVLPLINEYNANFTFNKINNNIELNYDELSKIIRITSSGNELGDHTWFHCTFIYTDPLCNGQNYDSSEGNQEPFPTNQQIREDCGNGKNAFGFGINLKVCESRDWNTENCLDWNNWDVTWKNLTDEQCQSMREMFSIYCSTEMLKILDELSNKYCGTKGYSYGSWNEKSGSYQNGIFSGSKTSCNHEIWERIIEITKKYYHDQYNEDFIFYTWSWPGAPRSPFAFTKDAVHFYYDSECTKSYNFLARFSSSIYNDEKGNHKCRSWTDVLRENGYVVTHDTWYPSRIDGNTNTMMSKQLIYNASMSRIDALSYSTNRSVSYSAIAEDYPETFFDTKSNKSLATQMYEDGGGFFEFIEAIRQNTSNGMIHGEVIDSVDTYSERVFLREMLEYCKKTGVKTVTKVQAYDICFNHKIASENLIYNPTLRNTAKEFMPDAKNVPDNPDGYTGDCFVIDDKNPILGINGLACYLHYGIPIGNLVYSANASGNGRICIYGIKNSDSSDLNTNNLEILAACDIDSSKGNEYLIPFKITDNAITEYEQVCEGMGNKYMGIKVVFSGDLEISNIKLVLNNEK